MVTDTQLRHEVLSELESRPAMGTDRIEVDVSAAIVTLGGTVTQFIHRYGIEMAVRGMHGVRGIVNTITVRLSDTRRHSDLGLASAASNALKWSCDVDDSHVFVTVAHGCLSLTGSVVSQFEKDTAEWCARGTVGIVALHNGLEVRPLTPGLLNADNARQASEFAHGASTVAVNGRVQAHPA